jgi:hypothetical protein
MEYLKIIIDVLFLGLIGYFVFDIFKVKKKITQEIEEIEKIEEDPIKVNMCLTIKLIDKDGEVISSNVKTMVIELKEGKDETDKL